MMTKVEECISADAGVGASIASGNQTWKANCAAFTPPANTKKIPTAFTKLKDIPSTEITCNAKKGILIKIIEK